MTFTFARSVTAFGFDWFNTDISDAYKVVVDGATYTSPPFTPASTSAARGFFGVVSTTELTTFSIGVSSYGGYMSTEGLDNVPYSVASATPVPEPASLALLGLGAAGILAVRLHRAA